MPARGRRDPDAPPPLRSGVILAGGRSSRIGEPKALLDLAGEPMLRHVARAIIPHVDELLLVAAPPAAQPDALRDGLAREVAVLRRRWVRLRHVPHDAPLAQHGPPNALPAQHEPRAATLVPRVRIVHDARPHLGPVSGIDAALTAARGELVFVSACDVPFLAGSLVEALFRRAERRTSDVVVPRWRGYLEPLATVYRRSTTAPHYARQLADGELRPTARFAALSVDVVGERALRAADPGSRSFTNVNAPADYDAARAVLERTPKS